MSALATAQITDILKDKRARAASFGEGTVLDFPFEVAAKTGTSKGYRDNWALGYTREVTVGVWVGNFDGRPMSGTTGITGAGPLFHAVMTAAMQDRPSRPLLPFAGSTRPEGLVRVTICPLSGERIGAVCPHRVDEWVPTAHATALGSCTMHVRRKVERQSGLLAGPACGQNEVEERVFEQYPPEYRAWARLVGRPVVPEEGSPRCPVPGRPELAQGVAEGAGGAGDGAGPGAVAEARAGAGGAGAPGGGASDAGARTGGEAVLGDPLRIVYPLSGAKFAIDPEQPLELQRLPVHVVAPTGVREVELRVDGQVVGRVPAPFRFSWQLVPGKHELLVTGVGATPSAPVFIAVRGSTDG